MLLQVMTNPGEIGWTEQKCIEMNELAKQNYTYHPSTEEFKRYLGQWYLTLNKSGKNVFVLQPLSKNNVFIVSQVSKLQNQVLQRNIGDGTLPQAIHGGTRPTRVGGDHNKC